MKVKMDYKQKYEQALERCKEEFNFNNLAYSHDEIKQKLKRVFPELKESEDERMRKSLIEHIKGITSWNYFLGISKEQMLAWLENQGEQKPAWSEEDEKERKRVVGLLEGWSSTFKETCYAEDCKFGIEWLKSLKPQSQWKPSKEQVEALRVYLYHPQYIDNSEDERIKLVESLYKNLIKLL